MVDVLHFGKDLEIFCETEDDHVMLHFKDGTTEAVDMLVGCDGNRSIIRNQLFGKPEFTFSGRHIWYGVAENIRFPSEVCQTCLDLNLIVT